MGKLKRVGVFKDNQNGWQARVWAPCASDVKIHFLDSVHRREMQKDDEGYWHTDVSVFNAGDRYTFIIDKEIERPDPASHLQPNGPHEASVVVDHTSFSWTDSDWKNIPLADQILYEVHVGTFTPEGTFEGLGKKIDYLHKLGITTIELMPIAQFPGSRNWGYDGTYPFAVQSSYGTPEDLKRLVNLCHVRGMAVILDVVYNHLGPEGNYTRDFAPYFTDKYRTPWGEAVNYDDAYSDGVRNFIIQNALYWMRDFHIDGLRLDAIHGIYDMGAKHILAELKEETESLSQKMNKPLWLIAESDLNDVRVISPLDRGGYGIDAQWADDFHHAVHSALTGENTGYYIDFSSRNVADVYKSPFYYDGKYSWYRKRSHGSDASGFTGDHFVVCIQNHDQIGNRMNGERLSQLVSFEKLKLAAGLLLCAPYIPLLFMGEESAASSPFLYFISHNDEALVDAVRQGRKEEFKSFNWREDPPDPFAQETFERSRLDWHSSEKDAHGVMLQLYKKLIALRKDVPILRPFATERRSVIRYDEDVFAYICEDTKVKIACLFNLSEKEVTWDKPKGIDTLECHIDSASCEWNGPGAGKNDKATVFLKPHSFMILK